MVGLFGTLPALALRLFDDARTAGAAAASPA
jgi:hypothetical protein